MYKFDPCLVHEWLEESATRHPHKRALIWENTCWSYTELNDQADRLASSLIQAGVRRHDRVVIFLENCPEAILGLYGVLKAGGVFVILNGSVKGAKLNYILKNSGAAALIADTAKAAEVETALADVKLPCGIIWVGDEASIPAASAKGCSWDTMMRSSSPAFPRPRVIDVDLACLIYTSGSTGEPKGVMSTHHNMVSAARSIIQYLGNAPDDIVLNVLPVSFDYGLYQIIMAYMFGGTVVLEKNFLFPHLILEKIGDQRVTGFPILPTLAAMLLRMKNIGEYDLSSLRYMTNTGAALPPEHIFRLRRLFPQVKLFSMFGLTECKRVGYLPPQDLDRMSGSVGMAMPNCETFVVDEEGRQVRPGEIGQLVVRGSNVMQGYWSDPQKTALTYRNGPYPAGRLLHSGDYFMANEEGYLYFIGRRDDMIKSKGERISAKEVEHAISALSGVIEVAVIGVADEIQGQAIKAFVVAAPEHPLTKQDIFKHCSRTIENFMVPKFIEFVDSLPRSPHGKIDKQALKEGAGP